MRIDAYWLTCDDGVSRPVVDAHVLGLNGIACYERFLVDIGADQTVFTADLARRLMLPSLTPNDTRVVGIGGEAAFVLVKTVIQLLPKSGSPVRLRGEFAAFQDATAIDLSVMGRDVLNHFDVIVSRPRAQVLMLAAAHRYLVVEG